ncbi:TadE/TadG family type IV pilus assembly protein [Solirubrobacter soli]|uniref:TadE/TadG family type IV pilus assembly protein n=1 Tax=Solirubrobacter soli TaxID=363832 RepID=UPI000424DA5E|nr:TadE/TadG family type IV pilus assembly protein [Solirubrobacter soli]
MSARLLIAVADDETARRAAAQAREAEFEVADIVIEPDELHRALRRLDVDVVLLHDALGAVPVLDLARDLAAQYPEVGLILLAVEDSPGLLRAAMQAGMRDVVALPLALESFESSVRSAAQWSRTMRDRVTGEESAGASLGGQLVVVAGAKGGVGTTTVALHLGMAAARMAPGRPVCLVDFDLQKGDFRSLLDTPHRRSVVDLVVVSNEISVRHLQETLYTHKDGFRLLLAPEEGEKAEDVDATVARNVLSAVKARHALTVVDIGAVATEATAIAAELAGQVLVVTTPDVVALRGVRRMRELWKRLGVREDEDVRIVLNRTSRRREIQPDLARKVVGETMAATTIPADFNALEAAVNTGSPSRMEDNKLRGAFESLATELGIVPQADEGREHESRSLLARLGGERGQSTAEVMGLFPVLIAVILGLWQMALTGYTYIAAGHAAREGARQLAVISTGQRADERWQERRKSGDEPAYRRVAREDIPKAWRKRADIRLRGDVTVSVRLRVPLIIPGVHTPLTVGSTADTVLEDGALTDRQETTPHSNDRGEGGNWN